MGLICAGADAQNAAAFHGLHGITDDIVKSLLDLVAVEIDAARLKVQFQFHKDITILDFRTERGNRLAHDGVEALGFQFQRLRPDGPQELA